mmetsp:Transcript_54523/g.137630  ORF Transcript_54523/g.137630 Transcript_54523/m.137630 type:complete len:443 (-) Transcript_54523:47-1375(-)
MNPPRSIMGGSRLASCLALLASPVSHAFELSGLTSTPLEPACVDGCEATDRSPVSLMQLNLGIHPGSHGATLEVSDEPLPAGRTILSTNPRATAEWMVTYYGNAYLLPSFGECAEAERAAVVLDLGFNKTQLMVFVKPKTSLGGDLDPNVMIPRVEQVVVELFEHEANYTSWFDNHDGFRANSFELSKAFEDGYNVGIFEHALANGEVTRQEYIMFFFPYTMYGIQNVNSVAGSSRSDAPVDLPRFMLQDCRDGGFGLGGEGVAPSLLQKAHSQYWKATFMANNPGTALDFAIKVLGAGMGDSPYEWPVEEGCTGATWAQFETSRFQLHFVNSNQYQPHKDTIKDFTNRVLSVRDLKAGNFDDYMYNSFIMRVRSLDTYVKRLQAESIDYMLLNVGKGEYALFASIPDNDITFQLRSFHVTVEDPTPLEMCTQQFGQYWGAL